ISRLLERVEVNRRAIQRYRARAHSSLPPVRYASFACDRRAYGLSARPISGSRRNRSGEAAVQRSNPCARQVRRISHLSLSRKQKSLLRRPQRSLRQRISEAIRAADAVAARLALAARRIWIYPRAVAERLLAGPGAGVPWLETALSGWHSHAAGQMSRSLCHPCQFA